MNSHILLFSSLSLAAALTNAQTTLTFSDGGTFDQTGIGETMAITDAGQNFTLTTIDIVGANGLSAATDNASHKTSVSSSNEFGINSGSATGDSATTSFNNGESWTAAFSADVRIDSIRLTSLDASDSFALTLLDGSNAGAGKTITLANGTNTIDETLPADIPFRLAAGADSGTVRIVNLTISYVEKKQTLSLYIITSN